MAFVLKTISSKPTFALPSISSLAIFLTSLEGLTEKQCPVRPLLMDRNITVVHLLINNGLSLQELVGLQMKNVHFENNTISVPGIYDYIDK